MIVQDGCRIGVTQNVSYTGTAGVTTNAVNADVVRLCATTACYVKVGAAPTATTSDMYLPANQAEKFFITPGFKVSAIQASAGGTISVTGCSQ